MRRRLRRKMEAPAAAAGGMATAEAGWLDAIRASTTWRGTAPWFEDEREPPRVTFARDDLRFSGSRTKNSCFFGQAPPPSY